MTESRKLKFLAPLLISIFWALRPRGRSCFGGGLGFGPWQKGGGRGDRFTLFADEKDTAEKPAGRGLDGEEDVRTLWIDYDSQGERFKEWRSVCQEASEHRYKDAPVPSPSVGVALCKHFFKHGGDPEA